MNDITERAKKQAVSNNERNRKILDYFYTPLKDWNEVIEDSIDVPYHLDPLIDKVMTQLQFNKISGLSDVETVCNIVSICQKFFHNPDNLLNDQHSHPP